MLPQSIRLGDTVKYAGAFTFVISLYWCTATASMRTIKEVAPNSIVYKYRVIGGIAYALMLFIACIPLFKILIDDDAKERFIISFTAGILGDKNA